MWCAGYRQMLQDSVRLLDTNGHKKPAKALCCAGLWDCLILVKTWYWRSTESTVSSSLNLNIPTNRDIYREFQKICFKILNIILPTPVNTGYLSHYVKVGTGKNRELTSSLHTMIDQHHDFPIAINNIDQTVCWNIRSKISKIAGFYRALQKLCDYF